jgi:hypothetical protein
MRAPCRHGRSSVSGLPGRRTDWNTEADAGASPRLAKWATSYHAWNEDLAHLTALAND